MSTTPQNAAPDPAQEIPAVEARAEEQPFAPFAEDDNAPDEAEQQATTRAQVEARWPETKRWLRGIREELKSPADRALERAAREVTAENWRRKQPRTRLYSGMTVAEIIATVMREYTGLVVALIEDGHAEQAAEAHAARAWRNALPELTDRDSVLAFIACVTCGLKLQILSATEAKTMIFLAQTQLGALKAISPAAKPAAPPAPLEISGQPTLWNGTDTGSGKTLTARRPRKQTGKNNSNKGQATQK